MTNEDRLRHQEEKIVGRLAVLCGRVNEMVYAPVEHKYFASETTGYLSYTRTPNRRIAVDAQQLLDMDDVSMEQAARELADCLDEMEMDELASA